MSPIIHLITISLYIAAIDSQRADIIDYCAQHPRNTPCVYDCMRSSRCGHTNTSYETLSEELRKMIVYVHNDYRAIVAGGVSIHILPPRLGEFNPLSYDKECEFIAGCYIKQCRVHPDKMRIALDGTHLGQNRFVMSVIRGGYTKRTREEVREYVILAALRAWFSPGTLLMGERIKEIHDKYYPIVYPQRMATFTQMIWENTRFVGCAFMHSVRDAKWDMYEFICNYRPRGNVIGEKVYELDANETTCQRTTVPHKAYMCDELLRDDSDDTYLPPINLNMAIGLHNHSIRYCFMLICALVLFIFKF